MKAIGSIVLALAVIAMTAANASANAFVWYSTSNVNGNGTAGGPGGAEGSVLNLSCNTTLGGQCSWDIDMHVRTSITNWISWATNLSTVAVGKGLAVSAVSIPADGQGTGSPAFDNDYPGDAGAGGALLTNSLGRRTTVGIPVGSYTLIHFTLSKPANTGLADSAVINASNALSSGGGASNVQWSKTGIPAGETVSYAGSAGSNAVGFSAPVINVQNVIPEPATLGLLVIGGIALIRRRVA
jgi:hypothetical protein